MAVVHNTTFVTRQIITPQTKSSRFSTVVTFTPNSVRSNVKSNGRKSSLTVTAALDGSKSSNNNSNKGVSVPNSNYVVPLDISSSCITRPLAEILRDLNKRIPDNIIVNTTDSAFIPWYHANRMLSFYAPGLVLMFKPVDSTARIRPPGRIETNKLPADVRKRAMDAVDTCGRRVTVGDVASRAGIKLTEAQRALQALAADTNGFLEVVTSLLIMF